MSRNRFNIKSQTNEGMADFYLEKMLSESAQFRAYNEHQRRQIESRRAEEFMQRLDQKNRLRSKQAERPKNAVISALATLFGPAKRSA